MPTVGDKVIVMPSLGENVAIPIDTPEVGDSVILYALKDNSQIAVPTLSFSIGDFIFNTPSFNFSGFNWNLDFNFQLIPLLPLFTTDPIWVWSWSGWSISTSFTGGCTGWTDLLDIMTVPLPPGAPSGAQYGRLGWSKAMYPSCVGTDQTASATKTFHGGSSYIGLKLWVKGQNYESAPGRGSQFYRVYINGDLKKEVSGSPLDDGGWYLFVVPFGESLSTFTVKIETHSVWFSHTDHFMGVTGLSFY